MESNINSNLDLFVYSHIPFTPVVKNPIYKVLTNNHCPDEEFHTNLEIYRDYVGDNISDKNLMFNEYSGFYWIDKNWDIKDYVGQVHYRRYFSFLDNIPNVDEVLKKKKIILNERFPLVLNNNSVNNRDFYAYWHNVEDYDYFAEIVRDEYPEYIDGWEKMEKSAHIYPSSLFIMPKDLFKEYIPKAIDVMNIFNEEMGFKTSEDATAYVEANRDKYIKPHLPYYTPKMQSRIAGYLVERFYMAFLLHGGKGCLENNSVEYKWGMIK